MRRQALLKAPLKHSQVIDQLENHPVRYMFMPICFSMADVEEILQHKDLNIVGIELVTDSPEADVFKDDAVEWIHSKNLFTWVNALTLTDISPRSALYGGLDDDISIIQGPEAGWGKLIDKGIDVIQTDWVDLVRDRKSVV